VTIETVSTARSHGGVQGVYKHASKETGTDMTFAVFVPDQAAKGPLPVVTYLSGLTCTHANVMEKGEYRAAAAEHGVIVVCPDTSPRGEGVPNDDAYDFGQGAGFYLNATQEPWAKNFRMEAYVTEELPAIIAANFPVGGGPQGLFGHSMGGHGALTLALRHTGQWKSVSAFSPIVAPTQVPWGQKALAGYLGADETTWRAHDAVSLLQDGKTVADILVDIGEADPFFERELKPELLEAACKSAGVPLTLRRHAGYDHSYFFISTFMADHIAWHAKRLK
jgi:S-formylglutathione hydrolase